MNNEILQKEIYKDFKDLENNYSNYLRKSKNSPFLANLKDSLYFTDEVVVNHILGNVKNFGILDEYVNEEIIFYLLQELSHQYGLHKIPIEKNMTRLLLKIINDYKEDPIVEAYMPNNDFTITCIVYKMSLFENLVMNPNSTLDLLTAIESRILSINTVSPLLVYLRQHRNYSVSKMVLDSINTAK